MPLTSCLNILAFLGFQSIHTYIETFFARKKTKNRNRSRGAATHSSFLQTSYCGKIFYESPVRTDKKSPNQETSLGNRGRLKIVNDAQLILND